MKPSILVNRRDRSSRLVQKAITVQGPEAAARLTQRLGAFLLEGEQVPDLWTVMTLLLRWLVAATVGMVEADVANEHELANDEQHRSLRDETTAKLIATLIAFRDGCKAFYGATRLEEIGFTEQTPRDPLTIFKVAKKLMELLRDPATELPPPRFEALTLEAPAMADVLQPLVEALEAALTDVNREIRKAQSTQAVKNEKVEKYDVDFFWIARWLEATFALAGMMHEAERLKPSSRRNGRTSTEPEPELPAPAEGEAETTTEP